MRLNRTLMERSIKLCICPYVVSQAGGNFVSQPTSQQRCDKKTYLSDQSWFALGGALAVWNQNTELYPTLTSLITLPLSETSAGWNKRTLGYFVLSETLPTFGSFGLALIGALVRSVCDNVCSAFKDIFRLTVLHGNC